MAKNGLRVMDSDPHVVEPRTADRPERRRAWSFRYQRPGAERLHRDSKPKEALEAMDVEGIDVGIDSRYPHAIDTFLELPIGKESQAKVLWDNCARLYNL